MKVRDLITKLQAFDPDAEIWAQDCSYYCEGEAEPFILIDPHWKEDVLFISGIDEQRAEWLANQDALKGELGEIGT